MKKVLLLATAICGFAISSFAQSSKEGGKFSIGVDAGLPVGNAKNASNLIIGGSLKYDHPIADGVFVTGSAGYSRVLFNNETKNELKSFGVDKSGVGYIPVKVGVKYFLAESFYGEAQVGAAFSTESGNGASFAYAPGIGYAFGGGVDLGVRYEGWSKSGGTLSQVAARLAYSF
nr:outer membrane beta-barrel protein [Mucilaginibacter sp. L294]